MFSERRTWGNYVKTPFQHSHPSRGKKSITTYKKEKQEHYATNEDTKTHLRNYFSKKLQTEIEGFSLHSHGREAKQPLRVTFNRNVFRIRQRNRKIYLIRALSPKNLRVTTENKTKQTVLRSSKTTYINFHVKHKTKKK